MTNAHVSDILSIGYLGSTFISDTAEHRGSWRLIVPIETTAFTTLTDAKLDGNTITGEDFPANHELKGSFTVITLASGAVMAYK